MNKSVIIVAAGTGSRFGGDIPKQFIPVCGLPVLMHTIQQFFRYDNTIKIIVVLSRIESARWENLINEFNFKIDHFVVSGGETRFDSVKNGLNYISDGIVAVHDGVRAAITVELIKKCFDDAEKFSNAIPAIAPSDSIRKLEDNGSSVIDRRKFRLVQTPQCFDAIKLKQAYSSSIHDNSFTDDASVFEAAGNKIHLVEGEKANIKITERADLMILETILKKEKNGF